ncbi:MAG TPA: zf-HC2 domain-containing protein [Gemmatimonadaceae bacterium]
MSEKLLTCAEIDELLPDYLEGELAGARLAELEAHVSTCARCQGLIRDIDSIRSEAAALPDLAPSKDLWAGIEARIEPPVVSITQRRQGIHLSPRMIGIAAAALIAVSSSITYLATRQQPVRVADAPRDLPVMGNSGETGPAVVTAPIEPPVSEGSAVSEASSPEGAAPRTAPAPSKTGRTREPGTGTIRSGASSGMLATNAAPKIAAEASLAPEIEQLQAVLRQRRDKLDPSTVKVVEDNLALIDAAVKQAREALARDPASGFLTEQLGNALQKKVELLRTVAGLPSRS